MHKVISVIVPIYNTDEYLGECLDSIVNQSYSHLEILLIDDGSTDNSGKTADAYASRDSRIKVFHKPNGGVSSARNLGIDHATGDYIAFVDSDDAICENYFESLISNAEKYNADICFCISQIMGHPAEAHKQVDDYLFSGDEGVSHLLRADLFGCALNKMYRTHLLANYRAPESIAINEDLLMNYFLFSRADRILFFNDTLYLYRHREGSASRSGFSKKQLDTIKVNQMIVQDITDSELKKLAQSRYFHVLSSGHKGTLLNPGFCKEKVWIEGLIRESSFRIIQNPHISFPRKCEFLMQGFLPKIYKLLFNLVRIRMGDQL